MEISNDMLEKLKNLSDEQLKSAIGDIADALGATPAQKKLALNNTGMIKRKLKNSNSKEISRQIGKLSSEKQSELFKKLKF